MTERANNRFHVAAACLALALPLLGHALLFAGDAEFSRSWSAVQSKVLTRAAPDGIAGAAREPFARVTTSFFQNFILVQPATQPLDQIIRMQDCTRIPVKGVLSGLAVADFDKNGLDDFAVADFLRDRVEVYLARSTGTYVHATSIGVGRCPVHVSAEDRDRDGRADISALSYYDRTVSYARGEGGGRFASSVRSAGALAGAPILSIQAPATVDFDTLENAIENTRMGRATRQALLRYLGRAERAYNNRNKQRTVLVLRRLIEYLQSVNDSRLQQESREALILMARELLDQLLAWRVSVDLTASPEAIAQGESATLTWTSFNAVSATIDEGVGSVPVNGSTIVSPSHTTTYTITATDADGLAAIDSQVVQVTGGANTIYVDATNGDDITGDGSMENPYRTITKGLAEASSGVTVFAAEGIYEAAIGETFPMVIPAGVTLQGEGPNRTEILGGIIVVSPDPAQMSTPSASRGIMLLNNAILPGVIQMSSDSALDSVGLYGGSLIPVMGIVPSSSSMGPMSVRHCRVIGFFYPVAVAPTGSGAASLDLEDSTIGGGFFGLIVQFAEASVTNCRISSSLTTGLLAAAATVDVSGSVMQGNGIGIGAVSTATGLFRNNSVIDNLQAGIICQTGAHPDFGNNASDVGNNVFQNLGAGAASNIRNDDPSIIVNVIGNTWDHTPPWTDYTGTFPSGVDIVGNGPNVKWQ